MASIAQLVEGIGGIGDQLAQEHVAVGIDRVHHEVQKPGDFGLEGMGLGTPDADATLSDMVFKKTAYVVASVADIGKAGRNVKRCRGAKQKRPEGSGRKRGVRLISRHANLGTSWSGLPRHDNGGWGAWFPRPPRTNRTNEATSENLASEWDLSLTASGEIKKSVQARVGP